MGCGGVSGEKTKESQNLRAQRKRRSELCSNGHGRSFIPLDIQRYGISVVLTACLSLAMPASTSSSLEGMAAERILGSPVVIRTSSSIRTPMPLYFSNTGRMDIGRAHV